MSGRIRFSLLTAILLTTIAAMGVAIWQLSEELQPLRNEVVRLRQEQGRLTITDPNKIYAIRVMTDEPDTWKWRVYLPPNKKYSMHTRLHTVPGRASGTSSDAWLQQLLANRSGSSGNAPSGEFFVEIRLKRDLAQPEQWLLHYRLGDSFGSNGSEMKWLDDRRAWSMSSEVDWTRQKEKQGGEGLELFILREGKVTELAGEGSGYSMTSPNGASDTPGIMFWIAPRL